MDYPTIPLFPPIFPLFSPYFSYFLFTYCTPVSSQRHRADTHGPRVHTLRNGTSLCGVRGSGRCAKGHDQQGPLARQPEVPHISSRSLLPIIRRRVVGRMNRDGDRDVGMRLSRPDCGMHQRYIECTVQDWTRQNRTEQNRAEQSKAMQSRAGHLLISILLLNSKSCSHMMYW